jgi:hypothetical protein
MQEKGGGLFFQPAPGNVRAPVSEKFPNQPAIALS